MLSLNTDAHDDDHDWNEFTINPWEVEHKLSMICTYKAPGPDKLPNWFLTEMAPLIAEPICAIFNTSLKQGYVPSLWKQANVIPVPKLHPPKTVTNDLRPISLTALESFVGIFW